jgi:hypothetical protein
MRLKILCRGAFLGLLLGPAPTFAQKVDLSVGWSYTHADQTDGFANLNGWYGSASYNVMPRLGLTVEHESYWGDFNGNRMNNHVWLGGVTWKLANSERKVIPFLQPLAGDTRNSSAGSVQHNFTFQLAGGVDIKLKGPVSLELIPAEYTLTRQNGMAANSYSAAVGLEFSLGK